MSTEATQPPERHVNPHPWRIYWRRMRLPAIMLLAFPFAGWIADATGGEVFFGVVAVVWSVVWIAVVLRAAMAPCPRCGGRIPFFPSKASRACPNCNWPYRLKWKDDA